MSIENLQKFCVDIQKRSEYNYNELLRMPDRDRYRQDMRRHEKTEWRTTMDERSLTAYIDRDAMLQTLCECIAIKSVSGEPQEGMPFGKGVAEALEFILAKGRELGFEAVNVDGYAGYVEYRPENCAKSSEMIGVLGHMDVVPAGDGWKTDPFKGVIADGKITGRGALDDKGPVIAALYAMKAVKESGVELKRRIRLIVGTDEETGSTDMERYKRSEELPVYAFTPDAMFPVVNSEKSMVVFRISKRFSDSADTGGCALVSASGGLAVNQVPDKAGMTLRSGGETVVLRNTEGRAAHGSTPEAGISAIDSLFREAASYSGYADFPAELKQFIEFYNKYMSGDTRGTKLGAGYSDEKLGDATFNAGVLSGDPEHVEILVDYRCPADEDCEPYLEKIAEVCRSEGMEFEVIKKKQGLYFPEDHELVKTLTEVYEEETGEKASPVNMGGGTYAKSLPNTVAFGSIFPGREDTMHQADEYIYIEDLMAGSRIYAKAMLKLANL